MLWVCYILNWFLCDVSGVVIGDNIKCNDWLIKEFEWWLSCDGCILIVLFFNVN